MSQALCVVCYFAGILCLVSGVLITVVTLDHALPLGACLGVALLIGGVVLIELARWLEKKKDGGGEQGPAGGQDRGQKVFEAVSEAAAGQAIIIILFGLILDHGVRSTACFYSCLGYWAGAMLVLARRRKAPTRGDLLYLRWGWLPILVIVTVLFLRVWRAKGLI